MERCFTITVKIKSKNARWVRAFITWIKDQLYSMKKDYEARGNGNKVEWEVIEQ